MVGKRNTKAIKISRILHDTIVYGYTMGNPRNIKQFIQGPPNTFFLENALKKLLNIF